MASLLNTSTLEILRSADETKLGDPWTVIAERDAESWMAISPQYRKLAGEVIEEMTAQEKATVDASARARARDAAAAQLEQQEDILRAFMLIVLDDRNVLAARLSALLDAIDGAGSLAALKTAVASINNPRQYDEQQLRDAIKARLGS